MVLSELIKELQEAEKNWPWWSPPVCVNNSPIIKIEVIKGKDGEVRIITE